MRHAPPHPPRATVLRSSRGSRPNSFFEQSPFKLLIRGLFYREVELLPNQHPLLPLGPSCRWRVCGAAGLGFFLPSASEVPRDARPHRSGPDLVASREGGRGPHYGVLVWTSSALIVFLATESGNWTRAVWFQNGKIEPCCCVRAMRTGTEREEKTSHFVEGPLSSGIGLRSVFKVHGSRGFLARGSPVGLLSRICRTLPLQDSAHSVRSFLHSDRFVSIWEGPIGCRVYDVRQTRPSVHEAFVSQKDRKKKKSQASPPGP